MTSTEIKGMAREIAPKSDAAKSEADILFDRDRAVVQMLFNRPLASNAVNAAMRTAIATAFADFARDPDLYAIVIQSTDAQVFCSGSDHLELTQLARNALQKARAPLAKAYALDWFLDCFSKPTVALIDGKIMGSGVGLTQFFTHRVAAQGYEFSMPETSLGFFPDSGMAAVLAAMPHHVGFYLALTGRAIGRADAYALGLLTHCIARLEFPEIISQLADAQPIDPLLDSRHQPPAQGELEEHYTCISETFSAPTAAEVLSRLQCKKTEYHAPEWIDGVIEDINMRSPTALAVTHRYLQCCRRLGLRDNLMRDYALACKFLEHEDFYMGVGDASSINRPRPSWQPSSLAEIEDDIIERFVSISKAHDLKLSSRDEM